jgi:hypothetical protein
MPAPGEHSGISIAIFANPDGTCMVTLGGEKLLACIEAETPLNVLQEVAAGSRWRW